MPWCGHAAAGDERVREILLDRVGEGPEEGEREGDFDPADIVPGTERVLNAAPEGVTVHYIPPVSQREAIVAGLAPID
mgnify:CR=1 FL=1